MSDANTANCKLRAGNSGRRAACLALALCGLVSWPAAPSFAADASAWSQDTKSAARLIAGANKSDQAPMRDGIEVKLEPGWHT